MVQQNKIKGSLEIVLKTYTSIATSNVEFSVPDLKTVGSSKVTLTQISQLPEHERVTIKVTVIKMNKMRILYGGKRKKDVVVADSTGKAIKLRESDIGILKLQVLPTPLTRTPILSRQISSSISHICII